MKKTGKQHHSSISYPMKKKKHKPIVRKKGIESMETSGKPPTRSDVKRDAIFNTHYELFEDARLSQSKANHDSHLESCKDPHSSFTTVAPQDQFRKIQNLTDEQRLKIKEIYCRRKKLTGEKPNLVLREAGYEARLSAEEAVRYPLFFPDIEDFLSNLQGNLEQTRWVHLKKITKVTNVILLCVEGVGLDSLLRDGPACSSLSSYKIAVEFVSPLSYGEQVEDCLASKLNPKPLLTTRSFARDGFVVGVDSMFNINTDRKIPVQHVEKSVELKDPVKNSPECATETSKEQCDIDTTTEEDVEAEVLDRLSKDVDIPACTLKRILENPDLYLENPESKQVLPVSLQREDKFSRLDLILTPREMANEKYPLPFGTRYCMFAKSKTEYSQVREDSPMLGLDCEMCLTRAGSELTRISVVNEQHEVVYERLVKPYNKIINYLTRYSGITPSMMKDVTTRLPDVQCELKSILPSDAILVGQSLNCDLIAMKVMHPYVIDTSLIYNMTGYKNGKTKLKTLCAEFLSESIQDPNRKGHDSIEDSLAALKLVQEKLKHSIEWGNACLGYQRTEKESRQAQNALLEKKAVADSQAKARLAFNSIVDAPNHFLPPLHSKKSLKEKLVSFDKLKKDLMKEKKKHKKRKLSKLCENSTLDNTIECDSGRVKRRKVEEVSDVSKTNDEEVTASDRLTLMMSNDVHAPPPPQQNTPQMKSRTVAIIGKDEVVDRYRKLLPIHLYNKVQLVPSPSNSKVVNNVQSLDSQAENSIIIAHVTADNLSKVNKWSKSLLSACNPNDLLCVSLNGSRDSSDSRGAFLSTVPFLDRIPSVKQLVNEYLLSEGIQCLQ